MYEASLLGAPARPDTSKWKLAAAFLLGAGLTALLGRLVPLTTNTAIAWDWTYRRERGLDPFNRRDEELSTPHKLMVDGGSTPVELQMSRGTCWIFAAMSVLEWSYRDHGVKRGWLQPDEYLRMSEQAFGVSVLDACHALPERKSCMIGAQEWRGSQLLPMDTQGGDVELLAYFKCAPPLVREARREARPHPPHPPTPSRRTQVPRVGGRAALVHLPIHAQDWPRPRLPRAARRDPHKPAHLQRALAPLVL